MNHTINLAPLATLVVFILGVLFTPILRKWNFFLEASVKKKSLLTELSDCCVYLKEIIVDHFNLLYTLECGKNELGQIPMTPVPVVSSFDLDLIKELYKECLIYLAMDERRLIRGVPERLGILVDLSNSFQDNVLDEQLYNVREVRNIIWQASVLYCELSQLKDGFYEHKNSMGSWEATELCLLEFGFSQEDINRADALKSMLSDEQKEQVISQGINRGLYKVPG